MEARSTNTIFREIKCFQALDKSNGKIMTIVGRDGVVVGSGQATIALPGVLHDNLGCIGVSRFYSYLAEF